MRAHETPRALAARERFLRERAVLRQAVSAALAQGYVLDPDHLSRAERSLFFALLFHRRWHRTAHLVPVTADFALRHQKLIDNPHELWTLANGKEN